MLRLNRSVDNSSSGRVVPIFHYLEDEMEPPFAALRQLASTSYLGRQICRRGGSTFYIVNPSRPVHFLPEVIVSSDQLAIR